MDTLLGKSRECFAAIYCKGKPVLLHFVAAVAGSTKGFQTINPFHRGAKEERGCGGPCANQQGGTGGECEAQGQPWLQGS